MLIMWEAQFGDFANGAQVIIDQFIASAESKWGRGSGLVMLLPHGYEGQGPEHSSARLERFLQLCAEDNIQVAVPTTPAQYFHLLRRQVRRRLPQALDRDDSQEPAAAQAGGLAGRPPDGRPFSRRARRPGALPDRVRRVLLCSGKVYYDLVAKRAEVGSQREIAIVRIEQLYPWPAEQLKSVLERYKSAREWVWVQEESQNMGAWTFVSPRLHEVLGQSVQYVGRDASASPATGSKLVHDREQAEIVEAAIGGAAVPHLVSATSSRQRAAVAAAARSELTMASVPVKVPSVGESISEGILARWLKPDGGIGARRASRSSSSRPTRPRAWCRRPSSGVLKIGVAEGETVAIGATVGTIDPAGTPAAATASERRPAPAAGADEAKGATGSPAAHRAAACAGRPPIADERARPLSPAVRRIVAEEGVDVARVAATGPGGRVTKGDVLAYLETPQPAARRPRRPPARATRHRCRAGRSGQDGISRNPPAHERAPPEDRPAPGRGPANRRDPHHLQRSRHVAGHGPAHRSTKSRFRRNTASSLGFMSFFIKASIEALKAFPGRQWPHRRQRDRLSQLTSTSAWPSAPSAG